MKITDVVPSTDVEVTVDVGIVLSELCVGSLVELVGCGAPVTASAGAGDELVAELEADEAEVCCCAG